MELLDHTSLKSRLSAEAPAMPRRRNVHLITLVAGGVGTEMVDCVTYPGTTGTLTPHDATAGSPSAPREITDERA